MHKYRMSVSPLSLFRERRLGANPILFLLHVGRERVAEVLGFEYLPQFDDDSTAERRLLDPRDGFVHRLDLPQPEAGNEFFRFSERTVDDGGRRAREFDALALRGRVQALASQHDAR